MASYINYWVATNDYKSAKPLLTWRASTQRQTGQFTLTPTRVSIYLSSEIANTRVINIFQGEISALYRFWNWIELK